MFLSINVVLPSGIVAYDASVVSIGDKLVTTTSIANLANPSQIVFEFGFTTNTPDNIVDIGDGITLMVCYPVAPFSSSFF